MIRHARTDDADVIVSIYNQNLEENGFANCDRVRADRVTQADKLARADRRHPTLVFEASDSCVLGWGCLKPFSARPLWGDMAEIAIYVTARARNGLVAAHLLIELLREAGTLGFERIMAIVLQLNAASIRGLQAAGFETCVVLRDAAFLHGRWVDIVWLSRATHASSEGLVPTFEHRGRRGQKRLRSCPAVNE